MKKSEQQKRYQKEEIMLSDSLIFDYYDYRLKALAQKIKMKNFRQKKQEIINSVNYI